MLYCDSAFSGFGGAKCSMITSRSMVSKSFCSFGLLATCCLKCSGYVDISCLSCGLDSMSAISESLVYVPGKRVFEEACGDGEERTEDFI